MENTNVAARQLERVLHTASPDTVASAAMIEPGQGVIITRDGIATAVSRDEDGALHAVSPSCTHMGCSVTWNTAESTWDCPCHGSRFAPDGHVLHGPALEPLETLPRAFQPRGCERHKVQWAALIAWIATAVGGATLFVQWLRHGGLHQHEGIRSPRLFSHLAIAVIGLLCWVIYLAEGRGCLRVGGRGIACCGRASRDFDVRDFVAGTNDDHPNRDAGRGHFSSAPGHRPRPSRHDYPHSRDARCDWHRKLIAASPPCLPRAVCLL